MSQVKRATVQHRKMKPGDAVPESGVYDVVHEDCPREASELIFIAGELLPKCRSCGTNVRFQLQHAAPHISEDSDFRK